MRGIVASPDNHIYIDFAQFINKKIESLKGQIALG
jgi:hypothetical protein